MSGTRDLIIINMDFGEVSIPAIVLNGLEPGVSEEGGVHCQMNRTRVKRRGAFAGLSKDIIEAELEEDNNAVNKRNGFRKTSSKASKGSEKKSLSSESKKKLGKGMRDPKASGCGRAKSSVSEEDNDNDTSLPTVRKKVTH